MKRAANLKVLYGKDIDNATSLVKELKGNDTNVFLYEVKQEDVEVKQKLILPNLPTVPGIHKLHQIVAANEVIWNQIMDRLQQKKN